MAVTNETQKIARRYAQILLAIMQHNKLTGAKIISARRGARHLSLGARLRYPNELKRAIELGEQVAYSSGVPSVLTFREAGEVVYQFGLREMYWKNYTRADLPRDALGVAESEQPVKFEFSAARPHTALAGATGSGKTWAMYSLLWSLASTYQPNELKIVLVDVFDNFGEFDNLAHLAIPRAVAPDDIATAISWTENELADRVQQRDKGRSRLVFICDEVEEVYRGKKAVEELKSMAKTGRQFKFNLILGSQDFKEDALPGVVAQLNNRFIGMVADAHVSARLTTQAGLNAHRLLGGGDFLHVAGERTTRFQVAMVTPADYANLPRAEIAPPVVGQPAAEVVHNFSTDEDKRERGRPVELEVTMPLLASYVQMFPKRLSISEASALGISRRHHTMLINATADYIAARIKLLQDGLEAFRNDDRA